MVGSPFLSTEQDNFLCDRQPSPKPPPPLTLACLLGDNDQQCDQVLGIQHEVFLAHNVAQGPSEEVSPGFTGDKEAGSAERHVEPPLGTPITPRAAGDRKAWDTPQGGAGTLGQVPPGSVSGRPELQ